MMIIVWIILGLIVLLALYGVSVYNSLVTLRNRVRNSWSQIEVQLKNRADLIPNLVETVKGYATHEKEVFENVTKARSQVMNAKGVQETADANQELSSAISRLLVTVEAYPELKADKNFLSLQAELKDAEEKIRYARQFYNDIVMKFNTAIEVFPKNIFANLFNFTKEPFFEATEADRAVPTVKF
ncbi:MAG: LemA family protein [Clostridium sp.]|nr:LemA family protein [Clostridium sp.]